VRIFYPSGTVRRKSYFYRSATGDESIRLEKVIRNVIQYSWLFLGAESACPMKRKSPVRRQEIMYVLSPKGGEAARRL